MTPRVFAVQFLDGHHYVDDGNAANRNLHRKALGIVGILLSERTDLVERFFSKTSLETSDVDRMIFLVYTEEREEGTVKHGTFETAHKKRMPKPKLSCAIKFEDMPLLADCANDAGFFQKKVSVQDMDNLMHGCLSTPLVAENLMGIAYFFDRLSAMKLISYRWQTILEHDGSILVQGKDKPQSRSNYSSALNRAKCNGIFNNKEDIDIWLKHIRDKYIVM